MSSRFGTDLMIGMVSPGNSYIDRSSRTLAQRGEGEQRGRKYAAHRARYRIIFK